MGKEGNQGTTGVIGLSLLSRSIFFLDKLEPKVTAVARVHQ